MRALITGGTGFVGRHLARTLSARGATVFALVRPDSDTTPLEGHATTLRIGLDAEAVAEAVAQAAPDVTFHLASLFRAEHGPKDIVPMLEANLTFGTLLLDALARQGAGRLINTGTSWQHYRDAPYDPVCLYAATKQAFETLIEFYVRAHGFRVTTLELTDTYGPDDPRGKIIALLMRVAASGEVLRLSPGEQEIDLVHIDDVTAAFRLAAERLADAPDGTHDRYAVSSGRPLPLRDLAALIGRIAGRPIHAEWGARPYRRREVMTTWNGGTLPGWSPTVPLEEGLHRLWNPQNGLA